MDKIELLFNWWIQNIYRQHERLQGNEDQKLKIKDFELESIDSTAKSFEENMEFTASEMEKWLIKNQLDK